jgi:hypothetical protein
LINCTHVAFTLCDVITRNADIHFKMQ